MGKLILYSDSLSQPCRAVYLFMKANNIDFELKKMALFKGESRTPEYKAANPFGGVPCLVDGDLVLTESNAIMIYLCDKFANIPDHWYPKDPVKRSRVNQFICWYPGGIRREGSGVFIEKTFRPFMSKKPFNEEAYREHVQKLEDELKKFEELFLKSGGFIFSDEISIADLTAASEFAQPIAGGFDMKKRFPKIAEYMDRVRTKTQPHFDETFKKVEFVKEKIAEGKQIPDIFPTDPNSL